MRRITSLLLAVVILVSAVFACGFSVSAESDMQASDECIALLKEYEGFAAYPYYDYGQYTVGYGTECPKDMYNHYMEYGITKEEAESLLRNYVAAFESDLNKLADNAGRTFTQNEFDALVLFSYNCGSGWAFTSDSNIRKAVVSGATGNELIYWFVRWCTADGTILNALVNRRLSEANLYLNGEYSTTPPENYCYVIYNANGGSIDGRIQGFDANLPVDFAATPTYSGHTFLGWYTAKTGGTKVETLSAAVNGKTLYARWDDVGTTDQTEQTEESVTVTVTGSDVNLRKGPGTNYTIVGQAQKGDKLVITATASGSGYEWGKSSSGWIALRYTNYETAKQEQESTPEQTEPETTEPEETTAPETTAPEETEPEATEPEDTSVTGTIKVSDYLNIRKGPGTGYATVGSYKNGAKVTILEQKTVGSMIWGKTDKGWISMSYVVLDKTATEDSGSSDSSSSNTTQTTSVTGTITGSSLRIRSGAGTSYSIVGYLNTGDTVTITEQKTVGSMTWGKMSKGWISMNYVKLTTGTTDTGSSNTGNNTSSDSGSSSTTTTTSESGTVKVSDSLRIRSGPGTSYSVAGYLNNGDKVTITEKKTVGGTVWGKISKGWISMDYVVMDSQSSNADSSTSTDSTTAATKTVTADCLRIRSDASASSSIVGYLYYGSKVEITETKTVDGTVWGKTAKGWISMDYVK